MKTKILVTESQYKKLLLRVNEQNNNFDMSLRSTSKNAPQWLSNIIGNKEDGYEIKLPQSDDINKISEIIKDSEVETYLSKLKDMSYGRKIDAMIDGDTTRYWRQLSQTNPKYKAAIVKLVDDSGFVINKIIITSTDKSEPTIEKGTDTGRTPDVPLTFPLNSDGNSQFFQDNEWVITGLFEKQFESEVINKILNKMKTIPNVKTPILNNLIIETSCSRLANGIPKNSPGFEKYKDGISFEQLSTERNNAAKKYVIDKLKEIGVDVNNVSLKQNVEGENKDGTSGGDFKKGDKVGNFTQFKYLKIKLDLTIPGLEKGTDYPIPYERPGVKITQIYNATLSSPDVPYRIPGFKWVSVWNPKTKTICRTKPDGQRECEQFDGENKPDKSDWSRKPKSSIYTGVGN